MIFFTTSYPSARSVVVSAFLRCQTRTRVKVRIKTTPKVKVRISNSPRDKGKIRTNRINMTMVMANLVTARIIRDRTRGQGDRVDRTRARILRDKARVAVTNVGAGSTFSDSGLH